MPGTSWWAVRRQMETRFVASSAASALNLLEVFEPHIVITDLFLGSVPSGVDLLERVEELTPWVGMVILTSHSSPTLATGESHRIPKGTVIIVKSDIATADDLVATVHSSVEHRETRISNTAIDKVVLTKVHCEILRLIAAGLSNASIANERGTSVRAAEGMVRRTFLEMGIRSDVHNNSCVLAVLMWQQGKVIVR